MKKWIFFTTAILIYSTLFAQVTPRTSCLDSDDNKVYSRIEIMPEWGNKNKKIQDWVSNQINKYHLVDTVKKYLYALPVDSLVVVEICFVVEKDGLVKKLNICCVKNSSNTETLYISGAKKILEGILVKMPKWKPGQQNGSMVAVEQSIKIIFALE